MGIEKHISRAREWLDSKRYQSLEHWATDFPIERVEDLHYSLPKETILNLANLFISWAEVWSKKKSATRCFGLAPALILTACSLLKGK